MSAGLGGWILQVSCLGSWGSGLAGGLGSDLGAGLQVVVQV